jgi:hypothetical protein
MCPQLPQYILRDKAKSTKWGWPAIQFVRPNISVCCEITPFSCNHRGHRVGWRYYMHELNISYGARHALTQCRVPVGLRVIRRTWINAVLGEIACVLMFTRAPLSPLIDGKQILIPRSSQACEMSSLTHFSSRCTHALRTAAAHQEKKLTPLSTFKITTRACKFNS